MTGGRFLAAHLGGMALGAGKGRVLLSSIQFDFERDDILCRRSLMTGSASGDRHIRLQATQRTAFSDIDMASGAFGNVLFPRVRKFD